MHDKWRKMQNFSFRISSACIKCVTWIKDTRNGKYEFHERRSHFIHLIHFKWHQHHAKCFSFQWTNSLEWIFYECFERMCAWIVLVCWEKRCQIHSGNHIIADTANWITHWIWLEESKDLEGRVKNRVRERDGILWYDEKEVKEGL